jgi:hypothetical protein
MSERRENGSWIIKNPDGSFGFQEFPSTWTSSPCLISQPPDLWPPLGAVAMFHTHPYAKGELLTECPRQELPGGGSWFMNYNGESSINDDKIIADLRQKGASVVGIIADANHIVAFDGTGTPAGTINVDRCGY